MSSVALSSSAETWAPTLAHLGGIDEIGVFLVPAVAAILALRWAERRARERREPPDSATPSDDVVTDPSVPVTSCHVSESPSAPWLRTLSDPSIRTRT